MQEEPQNWLSTSVFFPLPAVVDYELTDLPRSCLAVDRRSGMHIAGSPQEAKLCPCWVCDTNTLYYIRWTTPENRHPKVTACVKCFEAFQRNLESLRAQCAEQWTTLEDLRKAYERRALLFGMGINSFPKTESCFDGIYRCAWRGCDKGVVSLKFAKGCKAEICPSCLAEVRSLVEPGQSTQEVYHYLARSKAVCTRGK